MSSAWPLVGRQEELDVLVHTIGQGPGVGVVGGPAGVGKSRLVREAATLLAQDGWTVEHVGATAASATIPFAAFAGLLADGAGSVEGAGAAEVIRATVADLRARSGGDAPVVVVVDDAHHLDNFSALLVHQLALSGIRLLITMRSGEDVPSPVVALWKDGLGERMDLQPLSRDEVAALLPSVLEGPVERATADGLWDATHGYPLLLHELVLDGLSGATLTDERGLWQWRPTGRHTPRLRDVVHDRLGELSPEARRAVELVALSEPVGVDVVAELVGAVDLGRLERQAVLRVEDDGVRHQLWLWHPILADVVRHEMRVLDRRAHAAQLAAALRARGIRRRDDVLRVALLELDAGDLSSPDDMATAAMRAIALPDLELGARLARAAYAARPSAGSALALGEALLIRGDREGAEPVLCQALELADDDATRARVAWWIAALRQDQGRSADAEDVLDRALDHTTDPAWRQVIEGHRLQLFLASGRTRRAEEEGEALLEAAVDGKVRLRLVTSLSSARALAGRTAAGLDLAASVVPDAFAHQAELPLGVTWAFVARAVGLLLAGDLVDARAHVGMAKAVSDGMVRTDNFSVLALFEGRLALSCGNPREAAVALREARARLQEDNTGNHLHWALAMLAEAEALQGNQTDAERRAAEATAAWHTPGTYDSDAERALAWVRALGGSRTPAIEALGAIAARQAEEGQRTLELQTRHGAYRLGDRAQAGAILELTDAVDGTWSRTLRTHVEAAEASDGALLEQAAAAFEAQGALLLAAEAATEAAIAHGTAGLKARETAARRLAAELTQRCGPVRTPVLGRLDAPVDLTRREQEIVELAAAGRSNAQIAEELFLSVRTVEGHLLRAFAKLGVSNRASLAEALRGGP